MVNQVCIPTQERGNEVAEIGVSPEDWSVSFSFPRFRVGMQTEHSNG
jgi:hypothetical protein